MDVTYKIVIGGDGAEGKTTLLTRYVEGHYSFENLTSLEELYLDHNNLEPHPESIGNLKSLRLLYLNNNNLKQLPESISNLKLLETLDLRNNPLEDIPEPIIKMKSLKEMRLQDFFKKTKPLQDKNL